MDILDEDLVFFWKNLDSNNVVYLMVGGFAVNLHGYARFTGDVDIWIKDTSENRENLGKALKEYGYEGVTWADFQFVPGWVNFYIGSGIILDIMIKYERLRRIYL